MAVPLRPWPAGGRRSNSGSTESTHQADGYRRASTVSPQDGVTGRRARCPSPGRTNPPPRFHGSADPRRTGNGLCR